MLAFGNMEHYSARMIREQALLSALGMRLRQARQAQGLSVTELAERALVSRRYVTQAEAGHANLTVLKLARLAGVLRQPMGELCDLPIGTLHGERLALVGLRGAGKTTVGLRLALALEVPFVELDERIEEREGLSLAEIFDLHGVETYRALEREALEDVLADGQRLVVATGGSIVTAPDTFDRLREACRTLWVRAAPDDHLERVLAQGDRRPVEGRPRAPEELAEILERRAPLYGLCDHTVETSGRSVEEVVEEVLAWWE